MAVNQGVVAEAGVAAQWAASLPRIKQGSRPDLYLRSRGVGFREYPPDLRMDNNENMVALIRNPEGKVASYQRSFLEFKANRWLKVKKLMKNPEGYNIPPGSAIRLGRVGKIMGCAEGVETALSASLLSGRNKGERIPVWAAVTSSGMKTFRPQPWVEAFYVYADNDKNGAGLKAAEECLSCCLTRETRIEMPPVAGTDWNDLLQILSGTDRGKELKERLQTLNAATKTLDVGHTEASIGMDR